MRSYLYDRADHDRSDRGPVHRPSCINSTHEAWSLFQAVRVGPPYILISHSYGFMVARTFLEQHLNTILGVILADTATEMMYALHPRVPAASLENIGQGVDFVGLTHFREEAGFSEEEWRDILQAIDRTEPGTTAEDKRSGARALAGQRQYERCIMGGKPLSVMRTRFAKDYWLIYEKGIKLGNGTDIEREDAKAYIEKWDLYDDEVRYAQMRVSRNCRYMYFDDCGHDLPIRRPQPIAGEVQLVLKQLKGWVIMSGDVCCEGTWIVRETWQPSFYLFFHLETFVDCRCKVILNEPIPLMQKPVGAKSAGLPVVFGLEVAAPERGEQ